MSSQDQFEPSKFSEQMRDPRRVRAAFSGRPAVWPGLILVLVGTAVLLDHLGIMSADRLWKYWPVLLFVWGIARLVEGCNRLMGALVVVVGVLFLLGNLGYLRFSWQELWPVALIAAGVTMIWGRMNIPSLPGVPAGAEGPNTVNATTVFGGVERRITTNSFAGGTISATFGGVELDFRAADIEGEEAVLYVEALFGGIDLTIPERWIAIYEGQSVFGGYSDETRPPLPDVPGTPPKKRLILRGRAVFGGITVQN